MMEAKQEVLSIFGQTLSRSSAPERRISRVLSVLSGSYICTSSQAVEKGPFSNRFQLIRVRRDNRVKSNEAHFIHIFIA